MNIREALIIQSPSLALQRAAADEIARLDNAVNLLNKVVDDHLLTIQDSEETIIQLNDIINDLRERISNVQHS